MVDYLGFGAGLLVLVLATMGVARAAGVGLGWTPLVSLARAGLQLAVVAVLLRGILTVPWTVGAFLALMLLTASWTASGRLRELWHGRRAAVAGVLAGAAVSLTLVVVLRLVEPEPRYLVAVAGIVIGNAMSAATL